MNSNEACSARLAWRRIGRLWNTGLTAVQVVEIDVGVARRYGRIRADLAAVGQPIGPNDPWIAAHALALDLPLITHNIAEFGRIPELSIDTWMTPPPVRG